jgi:hypothetical protein
VNTRFRFGPRWLNFWLCDLTLVMIYYCQFMITVQFCYRYLTLCRSVEAFQKF